MRFCLIKRVLFVLHCAPSPENLPVVQRDLPDVSGQPMRAPLQMKTLLILAFLMLTAVSQARLGETVEQCEARYGKAVRRDAMAHRLTFEKNGILIRAWFFAGKCQEIRFSNIQESPTIAREPLSQDEIEILLKASSGGRKWNEHDSPVAGHRQWTLEGASIGAAYEADGTLKLLDYSNLEGSYNERLAGEQERLKGF